MNRNDYYRSRPPRCNGCEYAKLKHKLGDKFLNIREHSGITVYKLDAPPRDGQGDKIEHEGRPVRFQAWYMSVGHSDECYNWKPKS